MNTTTAAMSGPDSDLLDKLNNKQFEYQLPAIVYTTILMLIGTPGNSIVLYVYFVRWKKSTSRMFILFLTVLDLVNCVTTLPMEIFLMRHSLTLDRPWLCKITRFSTYTMNSSSAAILVAIAVDRFKRICRPHGPQFSATMSKYICCFCIVLALCLTWPSLLFYGTRVVHLGAVEGKACLLENKYDNSVYPYVYFVVMMGSTVVIFSTLSVLYYFVGLQVYRHRKLRLKRRSATASAKSLADPELKSQSNSLIKHSESKHTDHNEESDCSKNNNHNIDEATVTEVVVNMPTVSCRNGKIETEISEHACVSGDPCIPEVNKKENARKGSGAKIRLSLTGKGIHLKNAFKTTGSHCIHVKMRIGRSTLMLFLITLAYIVSFLPFYIIAIIRQTHTDFVGQLNGTGYMAYHVFLRSYLLSSAINPIIYSFCNAQFRTFCFGIFRQNS